MGCRKFLYRRSLPHCYKLAKQSTVPAYIIDISGDQLSEPKQIHLPGVTEKEEETVLKSLSFSRNHDAPHQVYMTTRAYGDFTSVVALDMFTNEVLHITTPEQNPALPTLYPLSWDISSLKVTPDTLHFKANIHGWDVLHAMPFIGPNARIVFEIDLDWEGGNFTYSSNYKNKRPFELVLSLKSHRSSGYIAHADVSVLLEESMVIDCHKIKVAVTPYKHAMAAPPTYPTQAPKLITFQSFDGLEISSMYWRPVRRQGIVPLIINIHGGPASQAGAAYRKCVAFRHLVKFLNWGDETDLDCQSYS